MCPNPIQDEEGRGEGGGLGGGKQDLPINFSPVFSTNVGIST